VIVVIGAALLRGEAPDGLAARAALAAAAAGSAVELITKVGDDPAGDALLLALARAKVGHVAVLRDPAFATGQRSPSDDVAPEVASEAAPEVARDAAPEVSPESAPKVAPEAAPEAAPERPPSPAAPTLEAADVGLALRYLTDYRVVVVVHPATAALLTEAAAAAGWGGAHLVVVVGPGDETPAGLPDDALVIAADSDMDDADGLGERLGRYVAAVDRGDATRAAFLELVAVAGAGNGSGADAET
jgi:hypothetical protein